MPLFSDGCTAAGNGIMHYFNDSEKGRGRKRVCMNNKTIEHVRLQPGKAMGSDNKIYI